MSCILNAKVPIASATRRRADWPPRQNARHVSTKPLSWLGARFGCRGSCFHSAIALSTIVSSAEPWTTWMSRTSLNGDSASPNISADATMPSSSIMHSSATTLGCALAGARSVASASPTVCTVCSPAPTSKNASPAAASPTQGGALVSPDRMMSANGMIDSPPNCSSVPNQR